MQEGDHTTKSDASNEDENQQFLLSDSILDDGLKPDIHYPIKSDSKTPDCEISDCERANEGHQKAIKWSKYVLKRRIDC